MTVFCNISLCSLMETVAFRVISMYQRLAMWRSTTDSGCLRCIWFALHTVNVHKAPCHCLSRLTFYQRFLIINQGNTGVSLHLNMGLVTLFLSVGYSWQPTLPSHFSKKVFNNVSLKVTPLLSATSEVNGTHFSPLTQGAKVKFHTELIKCTRCGEEKKKPCCDH